MLFGRDKDNAEHTREETVDAEGATTARVKLDMGVGTLRVGGGAASLMDAHFEFNEGLDPRVEYSVHNGRGELRVNQPSFPKSLRATRNRWEVRLNDSIPMDLEVDNGAGEAKLDVSALSLTSFDFDNGAGESEVTLNGDQLRLAHVDAEVAAGRLELEMRGAYPVMREIHVEASAGQIRLDLTGTWVSEVDIKVEVAAGEVVVKLPKTANIVATAETTIGRVKARGLAVDGNRYLLDALGAPGRLRLKAVANVGQVVLEVVE